jgi:hypothetical protein
VGGKGEGDMGKDEWKRESRERKRSAQSSEIVFTILKKTRRKHLQTNKQTKKTVKRAHHYLD